MRKEMKLVLLVAALTALCSFAAYATTGWVQEGNEWYYYDSNGDLVYTTWKQSGNNYYYLGDEGYMLRDQLISDGSYYYYVGPDGARVENAWQKVAADDTDISTYGVDYRWYFFGANGKAYTSASGTKTIDGKKYRFDAEGKMVYGFLNDNYEMILNETDPVLTAKYYFGDNESGAMNTGWVEIFVDDDDYGCDTWFYFNTSNGSKYGYGTGCGEQKTINSVKYYFDENGAMCTGWVSTTSEAGENEYRYYNASGALQKSCWVNAVPSSGQNASDNSDSTYRWFYTDYTGKTVTKQTKKISGKWYTFDASGRMKTGLVSMTNSGTSAAITEETWVESLSDYTADYIMENVNPENNRIAYFSSSSSDGSAKTGSVQIELADDTYTFYFNKSGFAANGIVSKKLYVNGILQAAGSDAKYAKKENKYGNSGEYDYYITNATGTVFTSATVLRDGDDNYIALYKDSANAIHYVKIASGDYASNAANYFKTHGNWTGYDRTSKPFTQIGSEEIFTIQ